MYRKKILERTNRRVEGIGDRNRNLLSSIHSLSFTRTRGEKYRVQVGSISVFSILNGRICCSGAPLRSVS